MTWPVLALLLVGFGAGLPVAALLVRIGHRLGTLDAPGVAGHRKAELRPVPNIGGIAIYVAVVVPLAAGLVLVHVVDADSWRRWLPAFAEHVPRVRASTPVAIAMLLGATALHVTGLIDDRCGLPPWPKFVVQVAAAALMVVFFDVRLLELLGPGPSIVLTIVWIVVVTNAMNFIDNMDGLAAGVCAIAAALLMAAALVNAQWFIAATLALLVGGCVGFLVFNFPPAKLFMGDGGSLVIGFLLAVLVARTTFYDPGAADAALGTAWYGVFMPLVVLAIPLYDLVTVTALRLRQGRSPFVGDQQHFSHRLVQCGLSQRGAVVVIWGATAVTGIGGVSLGRLAPWQAILVATQTLLVLMVIALLEHAARRARVGGEASRDRAD